MSTISLMSRAPALLTLVLSLAAHAQSFDCKLASTPREHAVCSDAPLAALDTEIAAAYKALRARLSPESAALVQSDQREWLHWIDLVCPAHGKGIADDLNRCLENQYATRRNDFKQTAHIGTAILFPRAHFLFVAAKPGQSPGAPNDPGFGFGSLRWPQADRPNATQAAWNSAVKARAAQLAVGFSNDNTATFDTAVDASGTIDAYFTVEAANDRLIDVAFTDGAYPWGAAHPTANRTSFLFWIDRVRELIPTDIFQIDSGWQQKLVPLAIASLNANSGIKDMLWKGDELNQAVRSAVPEPANWTITRDGLTITFGQYAVGPYVIGMPQAHLPWNQLTPLLAPTLNPATLPTHDR